MNSPPSGGKTQHVWDHFPMVFLEKNLGKDLGAAAVVIFSHNEEPVAMSCAAPVSEWQKMGDRPYFNLNLHVSVAFVLHKSSILYLKTNLLHSGRVQMHTAKSVTCPFVPGILELGGVRPYGKGGGGEKMCFSQCLTQDPCEETITIPVVMITRSIGETLLEERRYWGNLNWKMLKIKRDILSHWTAS